MKELIDNKRLDKLLNKDELYVIAVSTGIDSMSLLDYLYKKGYRLVIAHVNHKRREQSEDEYKFLAKYAKELNIPFEGYEINESITSNFQMEARLIRYKFFSEVCDKYNTKNIITAHQADDLVETVIFRLLRGTSFKGYSGIKEYSEENGYKFYRPLLNTKREDIVQYQKENGFKYYNDSSNDEDHYTRNKIRHNIVPIFKDINNDFYQAIFNYSNDMDLLYKHIRKEALEFIDCKEYIPYSSFIKLDEVLRREVIIALVNRCSSNSIEVPHERLDKIVNIIDNGEAKKIEIKDGYCFYLEYGNIYIKKETITNKVNININQVGDYEIDEKRIIRISHNVHNLPNKNSYMLCYNSEDIIFPINIRNVNNGDKITVNNITKKVYDLLKEHKINKSERDNVLVVSVQGEIIFVPNIIRKETDTTKENKIYITIMERS